MNIGCGGKIAIALGTLTVIGLLAGRRDKPAQGAPSAPPEPISIPDDVSTDDARLYIPTEAFKWPGVEFVHPPTPNEVVFKSTLLGSIVMIYGHSTPLEEMGAVDPIWTQVSRHKAYQSRYDDRWSTTWNRGNVQFRVSVPGSVSMFKESMALAEKVNARADEVLKMSMTDRIHAIMALEKFKRQKPAQ